MSKIRTGDIIRNDWAGEGNPTKYFMVTGRSRNRLLGVSVNPDGSFTTSRFDVDVVYEEFGDKWHTVGHVNIRKIVREAIMEAKAKDEEVQMH